MEKSGKYHTIEDFIFDAELIDISKNNDLAALDAFIEKYPVEKSLINDAFILLRNLNIEEYEVSQSQIDEDYDELMSQLNRKKKIYLPFWSVASVACACVLAVILIFGYNAKLMESRDNEHMLSLLDSISLNVDEIQVVSGSIQTQVCNNETIKQTKSGDVFVGEKEKIKSTDIETKFLQLVVPRGRRTSIKFSDGTVAWVNSGSKLVYPKSFTGKKREIFIEGEIYLEVTKDASKPFCVHSKKFDVVVLGTKFNINAYKEDTENSVVLVDGSVEVTTKSDFKQKLKPNQGLFFVNESVKMEDVDASSYISWKDGILKVNGESLGSIFNKLSRFYNVTINYDQSLALEKYRGKLELNDSIEFVLDNLSFTSQFNYVKDENGIQIRM